jgi:dihydropteroate synthase
VPRHRASFTARAIIERPDTPSRAADGEDRDGDEDTREDCGSGRAATRPTNLQKMPNCFADTTAIDDELSNRWIDLDPAGYFLIKLDRERNRIEAAHFLNVIDDDGVACDPVTKKPIPCDGSYKPSANKIFAGRTAKELSVRRLEEERGAGLVTMMVHANYLGREFQRAEACLASGEEYVQD